MKYEFSIIKKEHDGDRVSIAYRQDGFYGDVIDISAYTEGENNPHSTVTMYLSTFKELTEKFNNLFKVMDYYDDGSTKVTSVKRYVKIPEESWNKMMFCYADLKALQETSFVKGSDVVSLLDLIEDCKNNAIREKA